MTNDSPPTRDSWVTWLVVLATAVGLTLVFWGPLWQGAALLGGDAFPYYYPQKVYLSESLRRGELPLWNPLVGAGYPMIAESQTGVLYPPTLLLYRVFEVQTAYAANQLLHYVLAFVGLWAVARRYGVSRLGAALAGLVYVYGWFAPRICLEWAIIGGAYLPWLVWVVERWLDSRRLHDLLPLAPVFGLMLLAGHFHLAFLATLGLGVYVPLRLWLGDRPRGENPHPQPLSAFFFWRRERGAGDALWKFGSVLIAGYLLASVQLVPTLELMQRSQRQEFEHGNDPGYGHIPPWYLTQMVSSWIWYGPELDPDQALSQVGPYAYPSNTNKVEAHLYFGMVPLLLIVGALLRGGYRREWPWSRSLTLWMVVGGVGLLLAIGWPYVVLKHLPGFGYFRGAGRNSVLTALAAALLAGAAWDQLSGGRGSSTAQSKLIWLVLTGLTVWDLYTVSRWVTYSTIIEAPLVAEREASELRTALPSDRPVRLWAPGANAATLLGVSSFPVYLGLGPEEYFDPVHSSDFDAETDVKDPAAVVKHVDWLRRNGVTHLTTFEPLPSDLWPVRLITSQFDRLLSRVWARFDRPLLLYELLDAPGLIVDRSGVAVPFAEFSQQANSVSFRVSVPAATTIELRELAYPGWQVSVDGESRPGAASDSIYRRVEVPAGDHQIEWTYRPRSLQLGAILSGLILAGWGWVWWRTRAKAPSLPAPSSSQ